MKIWFFKTIEKPIFIGEIHEDEPNGGEDSDDGLHSHEERCDKRRSDDVGVLVAQLKLIKCKDFIELHLSLQVEQPLLRVGVVPLPQLQNHVKRINEAANGQKHVDESNEENIGD